jgi:hypothetical protein
VDTRPNRTVSAVEMARIRNRSLGAIAISGALCATPASSMQEVVPIMCSILLSLQTPSQVTYGKVMLEGLLTHPSADHYGECHGGVDQGWRSG